MFPAAEAVLDGRYPQATGAPASSSRFLGTYSVPTLPWVRFGVRVRVGLGLVLIPKEGWADACPPSVPNDGDAMNFGINSQ